MALEQQNQRRAGHFFRKQSFKISTFYDATIYESVFDINMHLESYIVYKCMNHVASYLTNFSLIPATFFRKTVKGYLGSWWKRNVFDLIMLHTENWILSAFDSIIEVIYLFVYMGLNFNKLANFWFPLLSQDYLVIQIEWLWLDLNTKKWFARPNLSLIKNGWYYHYQWQINYQFRPKDEKMSNLRNLFCMVAFAPANSLA